MTSVRSGTGDPASLGILMITKDNAEHLAWSLASVRWADDILVVDSGSTDSTVAIARKNGARVLHRPFTNFADQRNYTLGQLSTDWVLCLDADEAATSELQKEIQDVLNGGAPDVEAYVMARRNFIGTRWLKHGGLYPDLSPRLFRRGTAHYIGEVHEVLQLQGRVERLAGDLEHRTYRDVDAMFAKVERYARAEGRTRCRDESSLRLLARIPLRFLRTYLGRQSFRDGWLGLVHAYAQAKYAAIMLQEARRARRRIFESDGGS